MKSSFTFLLFFVVALAACKKESPTNTTNNNNNNNNNPIRTASYEADTKYIAGNQLSATYTKANGKLNVSVIRSNGTISEDLTFIVSNASVRSYAVLGQPNLSDSFYCSAAYSYSAPGSGYTYESGDCNADDFPNLNGYADGEIKITVLDEEKKLVSGEFFFDACGTGGIKKIRKGKFENIELTVVQ